MPNHRLNLDLIVPDMTPKPAPANPPARLTWEDGNWGKGYCSYYGNNLYTWNTDDGATGRPWHVNMDIIDAVEGELAESWGAEEQKKLLRSAGVQFTAGTGPGGYHTPIIIAPDGCFIVKTNGTRPLADNLDWNEATAIRFAQTVPHLKWMRDEDRWLRRYM